MELPAGALASSLPSPVCQKQLVSLRSSRTWQLLRLPPVLTSSPAPVQGPPTSGLLCNPASGGFRWSCVKQARSLQLLSSEHSKDRSIPIDSLPLAAARTIICRACTIVCSGWQLLIKTTSFSHCAGIHSWRIFFGYSVWATRRK